MPDIAYAVARGIARDLVAEHTLTPPYDLERLAANYADVRDDAIPTTADSIVLHAERAGGKPRIVLDERLHSAPDRRRVALAHALGHILLGWHPLESPCVVSEQPEELPVTVHDLVEGEAHAFARALLMPSEWIKGFAAFDRPAELMRHVAERAGVPLPAAARAVALQLEPGTVWMVADDWNRVQDAGRAPGTRVCPPESGSEFDGRAYARHAGERHRVELPGCHLMVWRFDAAATDQLPHDHSARDLALHVAEDLDFDEAATGQLVARIDGIAGWANEQPGTSSLGGMRRALDGRVRSIPELAAITTHGDYDELLHAKATELVTKRIAR